MNIKINNTWGTPYLSGILKDYSNNLTGDIDSVMEVKNRINVYKNNKMFLLSENVKEQIEKIVVCDENRNFDMNYIKHLPIVSENIIWDKELHYCYSFDGKNFNFLVLKIIKDPTQSHLDYRHTLFGVDIEDFDESIQKNKDKFGGLFFEVVERMIKMIVFLHMTPVTYKFVEGGAKVGDFMKGTQIKNEMKSPFTFVNIDWNHITIRTEGFDVRGHWRLQRRGKNWSEVSLKFIQPYEKKGYIRKSHKELV